MAPYDIPPETLARQHQASNPEQSVWVSANAGSGKTHVLASRVIRLLLQGVLPSKILCLTFTKAAAANMASGVFEKLARWTQLSGGELSQEIVGLGAPRPGSAGLDAARKLFARTLETPGGLKIQTIHAFCERLLHVFPFEANVPARFEVADERRQAELLERARCAVLAEANSGTGTLGAAVQRIMSECGPDSFGDLIKEAMGQKAISRAASPEALTENLRRALGLMEGRDVGSIEREMVEGGIAPERWEEFAALLAQGSSADQKTADYFRQALAAYHSAAASGCLDECLNSYVSIFFTGEDTPRRRLITNGLARARPDIAADLSVEQDRLAKLRAERKAAATFDRTCALIEAASAVFRRYDKEKAARGILDFNDLIEKTLRLLERSDAGWVLYKLDSGIDHILVDEAQDTSEDQWTILEKLTGEFTAGAGQSQVPRTFFAVGDEKQSIFSFQGAAPKMFGAMRSKFESRFLEGKQAFARIPLRFSFRSAPGVLAAVDKVFGYGDHKKGLIGEEDVWMPHEAVKRQLPSLVELWPLAAPEADKSPREWTLPLDLLDEQDPANIVAQRVAQKITQLIDPSRGEFVHDSRTMERRPVRPGDILILVRKRGAFFEAMIRALKKNGIPTAGADRLDLGGHIAVMDLIAAGCASLLPQDDLALACALKSPLLGLDDDDLLRLAPRRPGSLFAALLASEDARHVKAARKLGSWRERAGGGPFAFYAALLGADGGRRDLLARLGPEAGDVLDEFLNLALTHETGSAPSLASFLNDVAGLEYSVKRDMETSSGAVRVMTIHAAKGLEAKIVFLPDTCSAPSPQHDPKIFAIGTNVPGEETIAWSPRRGLDCEAAAAARGRARQESMDEYSRLLYVALTRAEERLYLAGFQGVRDPDPGCWARMIEAALSGGVEIETVPAFWDGEEVIRRLVFTGSSAPAPLQEGGPPPAPFPVPDWLRRAAPVEADMAPPVRPSRALAASGKPQSKGPQHGRRAALRRGRLIHLLLQYLPGVAAQHRRSTALAYLSARAADLDEETRQTLTEDALRVIDLPELAGLFGPGSKAEAAVAGKIACGQRTIQVAGQVDRIGEDGKEVLVADYKSGPPCALSETPPAYLAQMALYRAVLSPLWPNKTLRMLLIWTQAPRAVFLPSEKLDAALAAITPGG